LLAISLEMDPRGLSARMNRIGGKGMVRWWFVKCKQCCPATVCPSYRRGNRLPSLDNINNCQIWYLLCCMIDVAVSKQMTFHTARGIPNGCGFSQRHRSEEENQQCSCVCLPDDVLALPSLQLIEIVFQLTRIKFGF